MNGKISYTPDEQYCEEFYSNILRWDGSGPYAVRLPFERFNKH